eukprot:TRINITY_DN8095_c0_g1_i2.p3 TRINITY_DN8095_c0_g1~~TRINITY_DN8095_c0_g1_i2.p3  ORF type:complete len:134 (+),score=15.46 TRINITY_DN8095_c0_g1_i2:1413-1814(+)
MGLGACRASNYCLAPAVVFAAISVVLGIATLAIFLNWVYAERNDIDARDLPSERQLVSGPSVIAFAIGVVCLALGALLESFALCCIQREARHPLADIQRRPQPSSNGIYDANGYEQHATSKAMHRHVSESTHV